MINKRRGRWAALLFLPPTLWLVVGCSGSTTGPVNPEREVKREADDPLQEAREVVRQASEPGRYQPALELINGYLSSQPGALGAYQVGPKDVPSLRKALGKLAGADADKPDARALER